jgi:hypothetical protein
VIENEVRKGKSPEGVRLLPQGDAWLLVEFGGEAQEEAAKKARTAIKRFAIRIKIRLGFIYLIRLKTTSK